MEKIGTNHSNADLEIEIDKITINHDAECLYIDIKIHNLSQSITSYNIQKASYVTSSKTQFAGNPSLRLIEMGSSIEDEILPTLNVIRNITISSFNQSITKDDLLIVYITVNNEDIVIASKVKKAKIHHQRTNAIKKTNDINENVNSGFSPLTKVFLYVVCPILGGILVFIFLLLYIAMA